MSAAAPALAIVIRHDRDDGQYRQLGDRVPAVCSFAGRAGAGGTLIAPQWVLTAAHVGFGLLEVSPLPRVEIEGREYAIETIVPHPCYRGNPAHDLALVKLIAPVESTESIPIYRATDEAGRIGILVGRGYTGTGLTGPVIWDQHKRGATNRIDAAEHFWMVLTFDEPPNATDLEGQGGAGDSGGPVLIQIDGQTYVAGIESGHSQRNKSGASGGYGDLARATRVSANAEWIDGIMTGRVTTFTCYDEFRSVKLTVAALAVVHGAWLTLVGGSRLRRPGSFAVRRAGILRTWTWIVGIVGVNPDGRPLNRTLVCLGLFLVAAGVSFAVAAPGAWWIMLVAMLAVVWHAPISSILSFAQIVVLIVVR